MTNETFRAVVGLDATQGAVLDLGRAGPERGVFSVSHPDAAAPIHFSVSKADARKMSALFAALAEVL